MKKRGEEKSYRERAKERELQEPSLYSFLLLSIVKLLKAKIAKAPATVLALSLLLPIFFPTLPFPLFLFFLSLLSQSFSSFFFSCSSEIFPQWPGDFAAWLKETHDEEKEEKKLHFLVFFFLCSSSVPSFLFKRKRKTCEPSGVSTPLFFSNLSSCRFFHLAFDLLSTNFLLLFRKKRQLSLHPSS